MLEPALSEAPPDPPPLRVTDRQLEVLRGLRAFAVDQQRMPSVRELATALGRSASTVQQHLRALERRGYLGRDGGSHGLVLHVGDEELGFEGGAAAGLPCKGVLRPGAPIARERPPYPRVKVGGTWALGDYVLRVDGEALAPEGILKGDLVVVRPGPTGGEHPALIEFRTGAATIKRELHSRAGQALLAPATPRVDRRKGRRPPLDYVVLGRVMEVVRRFDED